MDLFHLYLPIAGMEFNWLILLAIGFCLGVMGGFFGMGGGWIVTPALNIFGFPMPLAIGTDLLHIYGKSIVAVKKHAKLGNVDISLGILVSIGMMIGVEIGARVVMFLAAKGLAGPIIRYVYMSLLTFLGFYILYDYYTAVKKVPATASSSKKRSSNPGLAAKIQHISIPPMIYLKASGVSVSFWTLLIIGILIGIMAGFMGVGGGFALVPAFIYLVGVPTAVAVGSSLLCCIISGAYGGFSYSMKGRVEIVAAMILLLGACIGAQIGASAVKYVRGYGIRLLYGIMLLLAATSVLLKQLKMAQTAGIMVLGSALVISGIITLYLVKGIISERG